MPTRLRVDYSTENNWRDFLVVLTAVFGGGALSLAWVGWWPWARIAGLAFLGSLVPLGMELIAGVRRRRYVTVTPDGFILHDRRGDHAFRDDQVPCISLLRKERHKQEELVGVVRTLLVWVETPAGSELVRMVNLVDAGKPDPLQELIQRLQTRLLAEARQALAGGDACAGEGWTLDKDELTIESGPGREPRTVPLRELTAVAVIDNAVCVWRRGEDLPVVRVSLETANAGVLLALLAEMLPEDEAPAPPASDSEGLGRLLFERKPSWRTQNHMSGLGLAVGGLLGVAAFLVKERVLTLPMAIGLGALLGGLCATVAVLVARSRVLRCHEHGVWCSRLFGESRLRYSDVASFRYHAVRHFLNGVYMHTRVELEFVPRSTAARRPIRFKLTIPHGDPELDQLRDRVSRVIAARMLQELHSGEPVQWTPQLRFLPDALEVAARGWLFRRGPRLIPYEELTGADLQDGWFSLWRAGRKKPAVSEAVGERNFFPGYALLTTCLLPRATESPAEAPAATSSPEDRPAAPILTGEAASSCAV